MAVKLAAKAALAVNTGIAEDSGSRNGTFAVDRDKKVDGSSSAIATLSSVVAETRDKNAAKEAVAHCVSGRMKCEKIERDWW